jgi:ABC-2 type transport system ATP-binding protein
MEASIQAESLVKEFKKGPRAVDGIDLEVAPGEIYGFLGPNGAGKSTTVHMLTTLLPPTGGSARVAGFDVRREGAHVREQIGAALQEAALDPFLTGDEHMFLQGALHGLSKDARERRGRELITRVGLTEAADRKVGTYSGGMRRRLDLALALVHEPRILFLDEPTTGLDPQSRSALWEEVERLARGDGVTVFLTTQCLEEADRLADRVGIIDHGRIVAEGTPEALKSSIGEPSVEAVPSRQEDRDRVAAVLERFAGPGDCPQPHEDGVAVRLGRNGHNGLVDVVRAFDHEGIELSHLQLHAPTLDDVFLEKTGRSLEGAGEDEDEAASVDAQPVSA